MGTNAIPFILNRITHSQDKPSATKKIIASAMRRIGMEQRAVRFYDPYGQERLLVTIEAIRALGPYSKGAVPILIDIAQKGGDKRASALFALGCLKAKEAGPYLLEEASKPSCDDRAAVLGLLGVVHATPTSAIPLLINGLNDHDINVRTCCASSLEKYGPEAQGAIPALRAFLAAESEAMKTDPYGHRASQGAAERALNAIEQKRSVGGN